MATPTLHLPDHLRCGSRLYYVTWPRLLICSVMALAVTLLWSALLTLFPAVTAGGLEPASAFGGPLSSGISAADRVAVPRAPSRQTAGGAPRAAARPATSPAPVSSFCEARPGGRVARKWQLATLGSSGLPPASEAAKHCDWQEHTSAQVAWRHCTYARAVDTQVSAYIHKEGFWNGWKRDMWERLLPVLDPVGELAPSPSPRPNDWSPPADTSGPGFPGRPDALPSRTLMIDIGANVGYYTLLFASRGYDVLALEPSSASVTRLLYSLEGNGIRAARSGAEVGISAAGADGSSGASGGSIRGGARDAGSGSSGSGGLLRSRRQPIVYVVRSAASDAYAAAKVNDVPDNPGADSVSLLGDAAQPPPGVEAVTTVPLDDLLAPAFRDAGAPPPPALDAAPAIDPTRVRGIKISAEGMDSRALHGMLRLAGLGRVPYVNLVFNRDHVRNAACNTGSLMRAMLAAGYRLYHAGIFIDREQELQRFLRNVDDAPYARSSELMFVHRDAPF